MGFTLRRLQSLEICCLIVSSMPLFRNDQIYILSMPMPVPHALKLHSSHGINKTPLNHSFQPNLRSETNRHTIEKEVLYIVDTSVMLRKNAYYKGDAEKQSISSALRLLARNHYLH